MATLVVRSDTVLPVRRPQDVYLTPRPVVDLAADFVTWDLDTERKKGSQSGPFIEILETVIDLGAGNGVWGDVAAERWPGSAIWGVEIRDLPTPPAFHHWIKGSFPEVINQLPCDAGLVWGNPPYYREVATWIHRGLELLRFNGRLVFLLPLYYLAGQKRAQRLYRFFPPKRVLVISRVSFTDDGKTNATDYGIFLWQKGLKSAPTLHWSQELAVWKANNGKLDSR